ncbi:hypothetical protein ABPG77_007181 [Micractinium sp. CCAP 211/92]
MGQRSPVPPLHVLLLLAAGANACGPATPLPNNLFLQLDVTGGAFIFNTLTNGNIQNPRWCPTPGGTPCQDMGAYKRGLSNDTHYVFVGDTCPSGGSWRTDVQVQCLRAANDTLVSAQRNTTTCLASYVIQSGRVCVTSVKCPPPAGGGGPAGPPPPCKAMQLDQPGFRDMEFSSAGLNVYRNGQVCNNQTGALWGAVAIYQCTTDSSIVEDTIIDARVNRQTCVVSITVASPRACVPQCTPPPPSGKSACGFLQMPQPAVGQAVLNVSLIVDRLNNFTITYFAPASAANSAARICGVDGTNKTTCLLLGKFNASASTPKKQVFDRGGDLCIPNQTKRYTADVTWVCFPGLRQDKLVPIYFNVQHQGLSAAPER